jgi:hypothetical protein
MRILIIVSSIVLQSFVGQCQLSLLRDLYANANFTPSMITQNQATTCELGIVNNNWTGGTGTKDTLYVGSVTVQLSWTARCNAINTVPTGTWASKFNWTFYPAGTPGRTHGGWDGISNQNIIEIAGTILFSTTGKNTGSNVTGANINVIINPPFGDSFQNDNSTSPLITVSTPAPVELSGFEANSRNCSSVDLNWNTLSERNNAYFEVLRSSDGKEFLSLGKVEGTNASQGSRYVFTDEKHLVSGSKYLYRLRQVDFDGKTTYHDVISYVHYCEGERSVFGVFPNPAFDRINTVFTGPFSEEVALLLLGNDGTVLRKMNTSPVNGQIDISNLPSGVYQLKVVSASEEFIAKFIKID